MGRSAPPRTWGLLFWLSLAAVVGAIETKNSGGAFPALPPTAAQPGDLVWGIALCSVGARRRNTGPLPLSPRPSSSLQRQGGLASGAAPAAGSQGVCSPARATASGLRCPESQDTHAHTRWQPRPCPGPTGGPGRRAGSARSRCPWCCAGTGRPAGPPRRDHTHWRARCTCTWGNTEIGVQKLGKAPSEEGLIPR